MKFDLSDLESVSEIASLMRKHWITGLIEPLEAVVLFVHAKLAQGPIVEIGSYKGASTIFLAKGSEQGGNHKVTAIDPWMLSEVAGLGGGPSYSEHETESWPTWRSFMGERYPRVIEPTEIILEDKWFAPLILALDHFWQPRAGTGKGRLEVPSEDEPSVHDDVQWNANAIQYGQSPPAPSRRTRPSEPRAVHQCFLNNITNAGVADIIEPIKLSSEQANVGWNEKIGLLFIDGDHSYEGAEMDYRLWAPFLIPGGTLIMHDWSIPGITKVIEELKSEGEFCNFQTVQGCFLAIKKGG